MDVEVSAASRTAQPARIAGQGLDVLDLCVDVDAPIVELRIAAGTFVDAAGHPSAAVQLPVRDGPSG